MSDRGMWLIKNGSATHRSKLCLNSLCAGCLLSHSINVYDVRPWQTVSSWSSGPHKLLLLWTVCVCVCVCVWVAPVCLTLCDPMGCSLPDSSIHGIFQARVLEWVAIAFPFSGLHTFPQYSPLMTLLLLLLLLSHFSRVRLYATP